VALRWTSAAYGDLKRIHEFLLPVNPPLRRARFAPWSHGEAHPGAATTWDKVSGFEPREVRRVLIQRYEVRYEVAGSHIIVLRVFHTREDRECTGA